MSLRPALPVLDHDVDVVAIDDEQLLRAAEVTLAVGGVLEELAALGQVALRAG